MTCDGKASKAADLKPGTFVRVTEEGRQNVATAIDSESTFLHGRQSVIVPGNRPWADRRWPWIQETGNISRQNHEDSRHTQANPPEWAAPTHHDAIFRHPIAHNLGGMTCGRCSKPWRRCPKGTTAVSSDAEWADADRARPSTRTPPRSGLDGVRHFLAVERRSDQSQSRGRPCSSSSTTTGESTTPRCRAVPQQIVPRPARLRPAPAVHPETDGKRKPERKSFYEAVAATLRGAGQIDLRPRHRGTAPMVQLLADRSTIMRMWPSTSSVRCGRHHLTEGQLLAQAREFFASKAFQPKKLAKAACKGRAGSPSVSCRYDHGGRQATNVMARRGSEAESVKTARAGWAIA